MRIMKYIIAIFLITSVASAHEMVPTYPKISGSYVEGLQKTTMTMFNKRMDVEYYEIGVFTNKWKPIPFASTSKIIKIGYNKRKLFEVYIRAADIAKAVYICTESKVYESTEQVTLVSSRICSKIKQDE